MPIRCFKGYVKEQCLEPLTLRRCPLVVDASNYFYGTYLDSGLPHRCGLEADQYAEYLRKELEVFRRAQVECYFVFKGGHEDIQVKWDNLQRKWLQDEIKPRPVFMKEIFMEVLDKMGFKHGVCECESKSACVELAKRLGCPILSDDIEFCFQTQPYIPYTELHFTGDAIECGVFTLKRFLQDHAVTERQFAVYRALLDEKYFPYEFFDDFMRWNKISTHPFGRHTELLKWLSRNLDAERKIVMRLSDDERKRFSAAVAFALVLPGETTAVGWLLGEGPLPQIGEPGWLAANIFTGRVSQSWVNMVRARVFHGDWASLSLDYPGLDWTQDSLAPCLETLQYVLDLLTDYNNEGFVFAAHSGDAQVMKRKVPKPEKPLGPGNDGLFEHWATNLLQLTAEDLDRLKLLPRDAGLLVMSLLLCARAAPAGWSRAVGYACVLRHVLGPVKYPTVGDFEFESLSLKEQPVTRDENQELSKKLKELTTLDEKIERKELEIHNQQQLEDLVDQIFEAAIVNEPDFAEQCARMCKRNQALKVPGDNATTPATKAKLRGLIIGKCQKQFLDDFVRKQTDLSECTEPVKKEASGLLEEDRMRAIGNVRFIGELRKQGILTTKIIIFCLDRLLENFENDSLESLCVLITTCIDKLKNEARDRLDVVFKTMKDIVGHESGKITSRVRSMMLNTLKLIKLGSVVDTDIDDFYFEEKFQSREVKNQHLLVTAQHALQQTAALRRLCGGATWRSRDVGSATNAERALTVLQYERDSRDRVRRDLANSPLLLAEFELIADVYDELDPKK